MLHTALPTLVLNVPSIARKKPHDVERVLGPPSQTVAANGSGHPRFSYRSGQIEVTFVDDAATRIILHNPQDLPFDKGALAKLGLPLRKPTETTRGRRLRWCNLAGLNELTLDAGPTGRVTRVSIDITPATG